MPYYSYSDGVTTCSCCNICCACFTWILNLIGSCGLCSRVKICSSVINDKHMAEVSCWLILILSMRPFCFSFDILKFFIPKSWQFFLFNLHVCLLSWILVMIILHLYCKFLWWVGLGLGVGWIDLHVCLLKINGKFWYLICDVHLVLTDCQNIHLQMKILASSVIRLRCILFPQFMLWSGWDAWLLLGVHGTDLLLSVHAGWFQLIGDCQFNNWQE